MTMLDNLHYEVGGKLVTVYAYGNSGSGTDLTETTEEIIALVRADERKRIREALRDNIGLFATTLDKQPGGIIKSLRSYGTAMDVVLNKIGLTEGGEANGVPKDRHDNVDQ